MASARTTLALLCVCSVMLMFLTACATAAPNVSQVEPQTAKTGITASTQAFYLRGNTETVSDEEHAVPDSTPTEETLESFERRELADYTPKANCRRNC